MPNPKVVTPEYRGTQPCGGATDSSLNMANIPLLTHQSISPGTDTQTSKHSTPTHTPATSRGGSTARRTLFSQTPETLSVHHHTGCHDPDHQTPNTEYTSVVGNSRPRLNDLADLVDKLKHIREMLNISYKKTDIILRNNNPGTPGNMSTPTTMNMTMTMLSPWQHNSIEEDDDCDLDLGTDNPTVPLATQSCEAGLRPDLALVEECSRKLDQEPEPMSSDKQIWTKWRS